MAHRFPFLNSVRLQLSGKSSDLPLDYGNGICTAGSIQIKKSQGMEQIIKIDFVDQHVTYFFFDIDSFKK